MDRPYWTLYETFLAVAQTGSLSAAARQLGSTQPTVGRQVRALEDRLGFALFTRQARGLSLTEEGARLLPAAERMAAAARDLTLAAAGADQDLTGTVRITASVLFATATLPLLLAELRETLPEVQIDLVASDSTDNLLYREADIAVRMYRPTQLNVITRNIGEVPIGIYATPEFLTRNGLTPHMDRFDPNLFVGYDRSDLILIGLQEMGFDAVREDFPIRCDNHVTYWELVASGCGIGVTQTRIGDSDPRVERILHALEVPSLPVWLTAAEALNRTPRIRRVYDFLADRIARTLA
ncbi:MAG: LysR family transcriptional regulator [Pseudomonadota bacterium]